MMSLETQNKAGGRSAAMILATKPRMTTARPDSHTKCSTVGTLRRAANRSRHPVRAFGSSFIAGCVCYRKVARGARMTIHATGQIDPVISRQTDPDPRTAFG